MKHSFTKGTAHWLPSWQMVLNNLDQCMNHGRFRDLGRGGYVALDVMDRDFSQADDLSSSFGDMVTLHTYISLSTTSRTSGPHQDMESVYCLQAQGQTHFKVWENDREYSYIMEAGDLLHIPSGIPHEAIPLTPRVLLSYGDESQLAHNQGMEHYHGIETS